LLNLVRSYALQQTRRLPEPEDTAQEIVLAAWQSLPRFACRSSFKTWLHRLCMNHSTDVLRAQYRSHETTVDPPKFQKALIRRAQVDVPTTRRLDLTRRERAVVACFSRTLDYQLAASELGISIPALKARLHRIREKYNP
jgi:RNA polymerase sigma-70 factor, ECF subfamily